MTTEDEDMRGTVELITLLGGPTEMGKELDVSKQTVGNWCTRGIPKPWIKFLMCSHPELNFDDVVMSE